jgi:phage tail sheath gpL-like
MTQAAIGDGPITFFTTQGQQITYPLSAITFEAGVPTVTPAPAAEDADALAAWLASLVKQGRLRPQPVEPPGEAMIVTAKEDGVAGNRITVKVTPAVSGDRTKVDIAITSIDRYERMTLDSLEDTLGTGAASGERPGLVRIKSVGTDDPVEGAAAPANPQTTPPSWIAASATAATPAFTVEARRTGTDPARVTVTVTDLDAAATPATFTLTATWMVEAKDVTASSLPALATAAAFAVDITPSPPTGSYKLPMPGTVSLEGGAEVKPATPARATILAG